MIISSVAWGDEATNKGHLLSQTGKSIPVLGIANCEAQYSTTLILMTCHAEEPSELALSPACPERSRGKEPHS
jgi:hypothetical protein